MGGSGSGRWGTGKAGAKTLVESCRSLDISRLVQAGIVRPERWSRGGWRWTRDGEEVASIGYEVATEAEAGSLRLLYSVTTAGGEREALDYKVPLVTTGLVSGGRRWWILCAACCNSGPPCRRRVGKLYLPPGGRVFACRRCYDLAYTSSRESRKYDGLYRRLAADTGFSLQAVKRTMRRGWA